MGKPFPHEHQGGEGAAEARARASFDHAWWAMATLDADGRVLAANDSFASLSGATAVDLIGRSILEVHDPALIGPELAVAARLHAGEANILSYPRRLDLPDGTTWNGTVLVSLVRDEHGRPSMYHVRLTEGYDRTPPGRIAWKEGDFQLALDEMRVGVAIIGLDGVALKVNRAMCELAGRTEDELRSIDLLSMTHPDDRDADIRYGTQAWMGEIDSYVIEKRLVRPDGNLIWVRQEVTFARDEGGQLLHLVGQVIDITDRKLVEEELARSRRELEDLVERLPIGLVTTDPEGRVTRSNPAAAYIAGMASIPLGFDVGALVDPRDRAAIGEVARANTETGADFHVEFRLHRPDATVRWIRADIHPDVREGGLAGLSGTWIDITALKEASRALHVQATHDHLTGLPNRLAAFDALRDAVARCEAGRSDLWVLFVDLDGFKEVNDLFGHVAGDGVLAEVGRRFGALSEAGNLVARLGGDEFLVLCERPVDSAGARCDRAAAERLARRITEVVSLPVEVAGTTVHVGASTGIAAWEPGRTPDDLVGAADDAVYRAKRSGRGGWHHAGLDDEAALGRTVDDDADPDAVPLAT